MKKITILAIGKVRENWLAEALTEYEKRLSSEAQISWVLAKDDARLLSLCPPTYFALDPQGEVHTSESFAAICAREMHHTFVIGGAEGLPLLLKERAKKKIRLSSLTFPHQMTRLILLEQIYRAFQIERNTPYHK